MLPQLEEGYAIVANLLDGTVPQITIVNGLIGHDHHGPWNWDGLWPDWDRVTFRAQPARPSGPGRQSPTCQRAASFCATLPGNGTGLAPAGWRGAVAGTCRPADACILFLYLYLA